MAIRTRRIPIIDTSEITLYPGVLSRLCQMYQLATDL